MIKIYALINPFTQHVFYVGATSDTKKRYNGHAIYEESATDAKSKQVNSIIQAGGNIELLVLEECMPYLAWFYEEFYICLFSSWGFEMKQLRRSSYNYMHEIDRLVDDTPLTMKQRLALINEWAEKSNGRPCYNGSKMFQLRF